MRFTLLLTTAVLGCFSMNCRPADKTDRVKVWHVSPRSLWESYRNGESKWTGERVRVSIPAENYEISTNSVRWHHKRNTDPPALVFGCKPPKDNQHLIILEGTVFGPVVDGMDRGFQVNWHVRIESCVIIAGP